MTRVKVDRAEMWRDACESVSMGHFPVKVRVTCEGLFYTSGSFGVKLVAQVPDYYTGTMTSIQRVEYVEFKKAAEMSRDDVREFLRKLVKELFVHEIDEHLVVDDTRWDPHKDGKPERFVRRPQYEPREFHPSEARFASFRGIDRSVSGPIFDEMASFTRAEMDRLGALIDNDHERQKAVEKALAVMHGNEKP